MDAVTAKIDALLLAVPNLPTLPKVADAVLFVLQTSRNHDDLVQDLALDPVLCAKVLRLANSGYYQHPAHIHRIADAVELLGMSTLHSLVLSSRLGSHSMDVARAGQLGRYCLHTAVTARYLAEHLGVDGEFCFTIGVLHAIGCLVMEAGMKAELSELPEQLPPYPCRERVLTENAYLGFNYANVGAELLRLWHFPSNFVEAILGAACPNAESSIEMRIVYVAAWRAMTEELGWTAAQSVHHAPSEIEWLGLCPDWLMTQVPSSVCLAQDSDSLLAI